MLSCCRSLPSSFLLSSSELISLKRYETKFLYFVRYLVIAYSSESSSNDVSLLHTLLLRADKG